VCCEWVKAVLVAQIKFTEWTLDNQLRQPVYLGVRTDKEAKDVGRE
jgi:bifunctional non-homologous end joining protein LigD